LAGNKAGFVESCSLVTDKNKDPFTKDEMKKTRADLLLTVAAVVCLAGMVAHGQFVPGQRGAGLRGPSFTGPMAKLFGNHAGFSANLEIQNGADGEMKIPAKLAFRDGKSRMEMDMSPSRRNSAPGDTSERIKAMGMDQMILINRPDRKVQYSINPTLKAYVEQPLTDPEATKSPEDFTVTTTLITRETVDGHDCEKNRVEIADKEGSKQIMTAWNAKDLHKFPVKIEQTQNGQLSTILFKDIKLTKPDGALFEPPQEFTKYNSYPEMFRTEMMKNYKGGQRVPGEPRAPQPPRE